MCCLSSVLGAVAVVVTTAVSVLADPNDWVNINYVVHQSLFSNSRSSTADAQAAIIHSAGTTAQSGPWSIAKGIVPPSGDPHDYLSWAPYHWPNCNWCSASGGRTHLAHSQNGNDTERNPGRQSGGSENTSSSAGECFDPDNSNNGGEDQEVLDTLLQSVATLYDTLPPSVSEGPVGQPLALPTLAPTGLLSPSGSNAMSQTSDRPGSATPAPAEAPAKTQKGKSSCTPTPTTRLAPSATWTTCPYVVRDGQVNPDVRTLPGPDAINGVSQSVLYNAIAYVLEKTATNSANVVSFIDVFFLNSSTKMNPNMNYGQVVRGPGEAGRVGTFTGILDLRGMVKLVNAMMMMKTSGSPDWTSVRDQGINSWMSQYRAWLEQSDIGKLTATRPNNHATFYVSQLAAIKMLGGDVDGAASILKNYFSNQFRDQIAASGEQPFEAVRTRPFHYRCFNLEAMITNAKLGDELGLDFWTTRSKYGATIQKAVDYTMSLNPKGEDITEIVPHVTAIAAAYGDAQGKYAAFLAKTMTNYQAKPFWFYSQTPALPNSPAADTHKRRTTWAREDGLPLSACPAVFEGVVDSQVELDNGIYVTCAELKPFYQEL